MVLIDLTNGGAVIVDDRDASMARWKWRLHNTGYAIRWRTKALPADAPLLMHRAILGLSDEALTIDHINRNRLDNRRTNLRVVTKSQNAQNVPGKSGTSSRYRGVAWNSEKTVWEAKTSIGGRKSFLGYHAAEVDAARAAESFRRTHMPFSVADRSLDPVGPCTCDECRTTRGVTAQHIRQNRRFSGRYRGVVFSKQNGRWAANCRDGKLWFLGYHDTELEAALAVEAFRLAHLPAAVADPRLHTTSSCRCKRCKPKRTTCSVEGCKGEHEAKGYCNKHYLQSRRGIRRAS
jgi:hypothetical protein